MLHSQESIPPTGLTPKPKVPLLFGGVGERGNNLYEILNIVLIAQKVLCFLIGACVYVKYGILFYSTMQSLSSYCGSKVFIPWNLTKELKDNDHEMVIFLKFLCKIVPL